MNGKQHFMIGVSVTASLMLFGLADNNNMMVLSSLAAPLGAMIPDIDHDKSTLGRMRQNVVSVVNKIILVLCIGALFYGVYFQVAKGELYHCVIICFSAIMTLLVTQTNFIRTHLKFLTKHRGIMHTLFIPAVFIYLYFKLDVELFGYICLSMALGDVSHLIADCCNVRGCPLLFPFTIKELHVPLIHVRTKSWVCYIITAVIMLLIIGVGVLHYGGYDNDLFRVSMLVSFNR